MVGGRNRKTTPTYTYTPPDARALVKVAGFPTVRHEVEG